ncbi:hypothetical protein [Agarilytica rhodophyticola]|uniref:hypothetical protein n=1 Tax=Agarilytica rhodophyticola TaxID=1737490 RepID=UPI001319F90F|nr:hypothetical protein [Agarilytica rhodophyticola]
MSFPEADKFAAHSTSFVKLWLAVEHFNDHPMMNKYWVLDNLGISQPLCHAELFLNALT